jgi:hypothetical protein
MSDNAMSVRAPSVSATFSASLSCSKLITAEETETAIHSECSRGAPRPDFTYH